MTRDDIIRMAREAGGGRVFDAMVFDRDEYLERFAALVADYVRAQYPDREALEQQYQAGCGHCNHPLYAGIKCGVCGKSS